MAEKRKENKFEFALFVNDFKIISRFFSGDNYNPKIRNSVDIRNLVDDIILQIQDEIKKRDIDHIWEKYDLRENAFMTKWGAEIKSAKRFVEEQNKY
jgi:hypothetical protein